MVANVCDSGTLELCWYIVRIAARHGSLLIAECQPDRLNLGAEGLGETRSEVLRMHASVRGHSTNCITVEYLPYIVLVQI